MEAVVAQGEAADSGWARQRVLITGATGFLGSHLSRRLVQLGAETSAIVRERAGKSRIGDLAGSLRMIEADLRDGAAVRRAVEEAHPSVVFHLAAFGVDRPFDDPGQAVATNVMATLHLLEVLRERSLDRFVYAGTCYEHADFDAPIAHDAVLRPANVYAATKSGGALLCAAYRRLHGLPLVIVRPFQGYGPWQAAHLLVPSAIIALLEGRPIRITSGQQVRDYLFVDDIVDGFLAAGRCERAIGETFPMGSGRSISVRELVEKIASMFGAVDQVEIGSVAQRAGEVWTLCADNSRAQALLGWTPCVELEEGLDRTITWFKSNRRWWDAALQGAQPCLG